MGRRSDTEKESSAKKNNKLFQKRQQQIVTKATKLFIKNGYAKTSMREISRETGIDLGNLYYFIKSKEEILFRVFEMVHQPEIELFEKKGIMDIEDPVEQLRAVIHGLLDFGYSYADEILLLYRESKALPKKMLKVILARESHFVSQIEEILIKGMEMDVFDVSDTSFTANMIAYELSLHPQRKWNLKKYSKEKLSDLIEVHIMKAVMKS